MRRLPSAFAAALSALLIVAEPATVAAQGFFESLFGGGNQQPARPPVPQSYPHRAPIQVPQQRDRERERGERNERGGDAFENRSGRYRTLCVRLCDGYYFPVSFATTRSGMHRDANLCRASCGEEAKLFYHSSRDADVDDMVDLSGRAYTKLPTAYLYRKRLNNACTCKPDPWAQSELDRHRVYAMNEAGRRLNQTGDAAGSNSAFEVVSGRSKGRGFEVIGGTYKQAVPEPAAPAGVDEADKPGGTQDATVVGKAARRTAARTDEPAPGRSAVPASISLADLDALEREAHNAERGGRQPGSGTPKRSRADTGAEPQQASRAARQQLQQPRPEPRQANPPVAKGPQQGGGLAGPYGLGAPKSRWPGD